MLKALSTFDVGREHSMDSGLRRNDTVMWETYVSTGSAEHPHLQPGLS
jgi:hypothetical protein